MSTRFLCLAIVAVATTMMPVRPALAQCLDWRTFPMVGPELTGVTNALDSFDDGSGTALYVGGDLHLPNSSAPQAQRGVVRWDGEQFTALGSGPGDIVYALASFDDGTGPALFASMGSGGSQVMKWNGSTWQSVSPITNNRITTLIVYDDGSGPALYAGGWFTTIGGVSAIGVAKWTGSAWSGLGAGPSPSSATIYGMAVYDDGTGPALVVAGSFAGAAQPSSPNIARWKAGAWSGVGHGLGTIGAQVDAVAVWDDGNGPALFASGFDFTVGTSTNVARWDGTTWNPMGNGLPNQAFKLAVVDDGNGEQLYEGDASSFSSVCSVHRWNGVSWSQLQPANPPAGCLNDYVFNVNALAGFDDGSGPHLVAGTTPGALGVARSILQRYTNNGWERLGPPLQGMDGSLRALHVHDDGSGQALYAAGTGNCEADGEHTGNIMRRAGASWHSVGPGLSLPVTALATFHFGTSSWLFAGSHGMPSGQPGGASLNKWDGSQWTEIGVSYAGGTFLALQQFGSFLYIGGSFTDAHFYTPSTNLARWSPATGYLPVGTPPQAGVNGDVNALATFDDGAGPSLFAAGSFTVAGPIAASHIVRFDGTNWSSLGGGMDSLVDALVAFDDGTGPALYAAGAFTTAGGVPASCVARWNGTSWSALGAGLDAQVLTLEVFDDGSGPALYAGGNFTASGNVPMERIAKWNGTTWSAVGGNIDGTVWALKSFDDGTGPGAQLFAGGVFHHAGTLPSENFAAWRGCGSTTIAKFCFGDGSDGVCPCDNAGLPNRGCENSAATGGARLSATGTPSPDTIVLHAGGELPNAPTLVFQGSASLSQPILFGDGMRCVSGNLKRLFTTNAIGGALNVPDATQMSISARSAALGDPLVPGSVRSYQTWYRDPNLLFCGLPSGDTWNLSNAVRIVW